MEKLIVHLVESYYLRLAAEKLNQYRPSQGVTELLAYNSWLLQQNFHNYIFVKYPLLKSLELDAVLSCTFTAKEIRNGVYEILSDIPEICEGLVNVEDRTFIFKLDPEILKKMSEGQLYRPSSGCLYIQKKLDVFFFKQNSQVAIVNFQN